MPQSIKIQKLIKTTKLSLLVFQESRGNKKRGRRMSSPGNEEDDIGGVDTNDSLGGVVVVVVVVVVFQWRFHCRTGKARTLQYNSASKVLLLFWKEPFH